MAILYVAEFDDATALPSGMGQLAKTPIRTVQTLTITNSAVSSATFHAQTKVIRVHTDAICSFDIAVTPSATLTSSRMPADSVEYFGVTGGHRIAVIANT